MTATRWSLRNRLVAMVIGLLAIVSSAIGVFSTFALHSSLLSQLDSQLDESIQRAMHGQPGNPDEEGAVGLSVPGLEAGTILGSDASGIFFAAYISPDGTFISLTSEQMVTLLSGVNEGYYRTITLDGLGDYRVVAVPARDGRTLVAGLPTASVDATVTQHLTTTICITVAGLLVVAMAGTLLIRRELRPLERVAATATRVAHTKLDEGEVVLADRVSDEDTNPATEVGRVGAALNRLLGHVESALAARHASEMQVRQFVADASHELRTPLASIRGYSELVRRAPDEMPPSVQYALERVESEAIRMTSLVEDLLLLARLDAGRTLDHRPVDMAVLAANAVADAHAAGPDHIWHLELPGSGTDWSDEQTDADHDGVTATVDETWVGPEENGETDDEPANVTVLGDEHALHQVLANLLSNARVHTPAGTTVTTTVTEHGGTVTVTVHDDGPGIPVSLQGHLFDRFSRGDPSRSPGTGSTGLGLSIADAVTRAHGGRISVDGTPGATRFTVTFPTSPPSSAPGTA